jgi:hypothetical protein
LTSKLQNTARRELCGKLEEANARYEALKGKYLKEMI